MSKKEIKEKIIKIIIKNLYLTSYKGGFGGLTKEEKKIISQLLQLFTCHEKEILWEFQKIVQRYFKKVLKLPCPDFRHNLKRSSQKINK